MYHSQSRFALITSAHEAEKAITPRRNIISLCSHYRQASTERLVNGVGNPFLSIFLWPLTMKASKVMKLLRLCLLCARSKWLQQPKMRERWEQGVGCEKTNDALPGSRRIDYDGLTAFPSHNDAVALFFHVYPLAGCCSFPLTSPACPCRLRATRETFDAWPPSLAFIEKKKKRWQ